MTPHFFCKIPLLYYIHRPYNVNGNKLTGGSIEKSNNRDRKTDHSIFKIQCDTSRRSNIIQKKWNDYPHIFGCILHIRNRSTKHSRWIFIPRTKIKHTDRINAPGKRARTCRMHHNKKCHGISQGAELGGLF